MQERLKEKYVPWSYQKKYLSQSYQGNFIDKEKYICYWLHDTIEKDKMSVCAISSPNPTPASMEAILEAIQDLSMKIKAMALSS